MAMYPSCQSLLTATSFRDASMNAAPLGPEPRRARWWLEGAS